MAVMDTTWYACTGRFHGPASQRSADSGIGVFSLLGIFRRGSLNTLFLFEVFSNRADLYNRGASAYYAGITGRPLTAHDGVETRNIILRRPEPEVTAVCTSIYLGSF